MAKIRRGISTKTGKLGKADKRLNGRITAWEKMGEDKGRTSDIFRKHGYAGFKKPGAMK